MTEGVNQTSCSRLKFDFAADPQMYKAEKANEFGLFPLFSAWCSNNYIMLSFNHIWDDDH